MMKKNEIIARIAFNHVQGLGPRLIRRILDFFSSGENALRSSIPEVSKVTSIDEHFVKEAFAYYENGKAVSEMEKAEEMGCSIVIEEDVRYPSMLKEIFNPPPVLYVWGDTDCLKKSVSIVGSRRSSIYGTQTATRLSGQLCSNGFSVVSGLARGIDTAAHRGSLAAGGKTVAFIGSGLCRLYPRENLKLAEKIAANGAVISEFPLNMEAFAGNFPRRNRLISGCTLGVVVVEASSKSGSLITAKHALEQGRSVFAVPGRIDSPLSRGSHMLLREGARLVEGVEDILDELQFVTGVNYDNLIVSSPREMLLDKSEKLLWSEFGVDPVSIDDLVERTGLETATVSRSLLCLEMKKVIKKLPGMKYIKV